MRRLQSGNEGGEVLIAKCDSRNTRWNGDGSSIRPQKKVDDDASPNVAKVMNATYRSVRDCVAKARYKCFTKGATTRCTSRWMLHEGKYVDALFPYQQGYRL